MNKICVLGAGSWGSALALSLAKKGYDVTMWTLSQEQADKVNLTKENIDYLPGVLFPNNIILDEIEYILTGINIIIKNNKKCFSVKSLSLLIT